MWTVPGVVESEWTDDDPSVRQLDVVRHHVDADGVADVDAHERHTEYGDEEDECHLTS